MLTLVPAATFDAEFDAEFKDAVTTARAAIPTMKALTIQAAWTDLRIVRTPSGRLAVYQASAWDQPSTPPVLPWGAPVGEVIATVSHVDGAVTRH